MESATLPPPNCLASLNLEGGYSTSSSDLLQDFYVPCLSVSDRYDRAAGFFSGALLALAPIAFADFVDRGGKMRLICSPRMTAEDYEAIADGASAESVARGVAATNLKALVDASEPGQVLSRALSSLVASAVLQVKIAIPLSERGLFHDKVGIFEDSCGHRISFVGSANESAAAWSGLANHEQVEVFPSSLSNESEQRCRRHSQLFEETWLNARRGLRVMSATAAADLITSIVSPEPVAQVLAAVRQLRQREAPNDRHNSKLKTLMPHQTDVLDDWRAHGFRGLVAFATGGGKTLAAMAALREWCGAGRPAIVLVPSEILHHQWLSETRCEVPDAKVLTVGAGANTDNWIAALQGYTAPDARLGPRVVIATYQTARTPRFLERVHVGDHLLLVADEVHRVGAKDTQRILEVVSAGGRLGLSATPERYGDPAGTARITSYFGDVLKPRFTIEDAIQAGRLVPYIYRFAQVSLTVDEQDDWDDLSKRISVAFARSGGGDDLSEYLEDLLRRRARILKRASGKTAVARQVLEERYRVGDRWLVYCESAAQLASVRAAVQDLRMPVMEYHQAMPGGRDATLEYFEKQGGVLLAIKCLDEGVDIPATNRALILASTTNPREYIQRRGRVLRASRDKFHAEVFDVIVNDLDGLPLAISELQRAAEFAHAADNVSATIELRRLIANAASTDSWRRSTQTEDREADSD